MAYVNAPPLLMPFEKNPRCFVCKRIFTVTRRAAHCRNCGVCICNSCTTHWKKLMIPQTYNAKNKRSVRVCKTCNYLSTAFRHALVCGNYELANSIYMTGNINLRCPFMNVKKENEIQLPVHCATIGGNLKILSWLVDVHHCPLKLINLGKKNKTMSEKLITTSKNRTVLDIAMVNQKVDILHYLVQEQKVPLNEGSNKNRASLAALEAVLKAFPEVPVGCYSPTYGNHKTRVDLKTEESRLSFTTTGTYDEEESADDDEDSLNYDYIKNIVEEEVGSDEDVDADADDADADDEQSVY